MNFFSPKIHIALLYLGILGFFYFALTVNVIRTRWKHKVPLGAGQNRTMEQVIRVHGHFNEYVPFISLMLILLEINKMPNEALHFFWICLVLSRVFHAWGLLTSHTISKGRFIGMILTAVCLVGASFSLLANYVRNL